MALVRGTGASQGKKKKVVRAGTQGRGGVNQPTQQGARSVTKHVYRGVSFYSTTGKELPKRWQEGIVKAASKVPEKVWDRLAMANAKVFVQENKDPGIAPMFMEYLDGIGVPRKWANDVYSKDIAYTDLSGAPVAVVGIGALAPWPNGTPRTFARGEGTNHVLLHETAHTLDFSFQIMKVIGAAYHGLDRKTPGSAKRAEQVARDINNEPFSTVDPSKTSVSHTKAWNKTVPENYTAGYGDPSKLYDTETSYPKSEVYAESLANYWDEKRRKKLPPKMTKFFDNYFSEGW
jgi:hypothetical protein